MNYKNLLLVLFCFIGNKITAQTTYTSYFTGDTTDVTTATKGGVCLMGGATESDDAMRWFLGQASGGDILIIRASGSNGYNTYLYSTLGMTVNSVESIVINNAAAANDPYVLRRIREAEAVWIAGGNQANYVNFWKNSPMRAALNDLIRNKKAVIGGTSAGMAILGGGYFAALNGSITTAAALANPYDAAATLGYGDFINYPHLQNVITDTHYDNPDRRGRQVAFMARLQRDFGVQRPLGIACEEYTAFCVDSTGEGKVFGPVGQNAYFIQTNCLRPNQAETCIANTPLTWSQDGEALKVYVIPATVAGTGTFNITDWDRGGTGGAWENWSVQAGVFTAVASFESPCAGATSGINPFPNIVIYPNPSSDFLTVKNMENVTSLEVCDSNGKILLQKNVKNTTESIDLGGFAAASYYLVLRNANSSYSFGFVKK